MTLPGLNRPDFLSRIHALTDASRGARPELSAILQGLAQHIPPRQMNAFVEAAEIAATQDRTTRLSDLLDSLILGNRISLWGAVLEFQTRAALDVIADEILLRQEYHFATRSEAPLVIDAGANIGLATYYVRRMCKAARVICFEPNPATFAVLEGNARINRWDNVTLHQAAIAACDGHADLVFEEESPLAASLSPRRIGASARRQTVPTLALNAFLQEPVALLKMDIEGAEADVLEACEGNLSQVENLFVEVHPMPGESPSLLCRTLGVLERAGFYVHVARSPWSEAVHGNKPLTRAHRTYSLSVYATRLKS